MAIRESGALSGVFYPHKRLVFRVRPSKVEVSPDSMLKVGRFPIAVDVFEAAIDERSCPASMSALAPKEATIICAATMVSLAGKVGGTVVPW